MGHFVADDGHFQGWLAILLCCWAAVNEDESPAERRRPTLGTDGYRAGAGNQQAASKSVEMRMATVYDRGHRSHERDVMADPDQIFAASPSDMEQFERTSGHARLSENEDLIRHALGPSSSSAKASQRLEKHKVPQATLAPGQKAPKVSQAPSVSSTDVPMTVSETIASRARDTAECNEKLATNFRRESYRALRDSPFQRCQKRSSGSPVVPTHASERDLRAGTLAEMQQSGSRKTVSVSSHTSSSSLKQQAWDSNISVTQARTSMERGRLKRQSSRQSMRQPREDRYPDLDQDILRPQIIVKEQSQMEAKQEDSLDQHVAAVAPSMRVHARSESLKDIGSALARPLNARQNSKPIDIFETVDKTKQSPVSRASSRTRVSGWLSNLLPTSSTHFAMPSSEHLFKDVSPESHTRPRWQASSSASATELEGLTRPTGTTSPASKTHDQSLAADFSLTPGSAPSPMCDHEVVDDGNDEVEQWVTYKAPPHQVGLAL
ncbi:hypothetical protein B0A50_06618 [Salinomyces thailandicus]|uniref:Uncharacterized protein n=1 Tax=Salinomyces thailandicus TaxID=706561 RepID=A0A4V5N3T2_9PEZI|nr:hypothetical protein B0A50_06618 [Salinomyces thailandica]